MNTFRSRRALPMNVLVGATAMPDETEHICVRCCNADALPSLAVCAVCALELKAECSDGMARLAEYLSAWAAFDEWLRQRGSEPA